MYAFSASFGSDGSATATTTQTAVGTFATGEYVIVPIDWGANTGSITSVVDNLGNTYTQVGALEQTNFSTALYYCASAIGGAATITVTWSAAQTFQRIRAIRYTGLTGAPQTSALFNQFNPATTTDTVTSGAVTPTSNPAMLFGWSYNTYNVTIAAGTGFTARDAVAGAAGYSLLEDKRLTANTATAATFTNAAATAACKTYALVISEATAAAPLGGGFKKLLLAMGYFSIMAMAIPAYIAGADIGGWRTYTPTPLNTTTYATANYAQPGTRIYYVDPSMVPLSTVSLDIAAGDFYLWNGTNVVDSSGSTTGAGGVPYGTDPQNPSGPIKPYTRIGYCLYDRDGQNRVNGQTQRGDYHSAGCGAYNTGLGRNAFPDWFMIKRGTTLLLEDDIYATSLEGNPSVSKSSMYGTLSIPGGASLTAMSNVMAYGAPATVRPIITKCPLFGFIYSSGSTKPIQFTNYVSLYIDGHNRAHYTGPRGGLYYSNTVGAVNTPTVFYEDVMFDGTGGIVIQNNTTFCVNFYRCPVLDTFDPSNVSGIFLSNSGLSQVNFFDSIIGRNGSPTDPVIGFTENIYNRNVYQGGEADCVNGIFDNVLMLPGASGDQFRAGINLRRSYFMNAGVGLAGQNGAPYATGQTNTGSFQNNVMERHYQAITGGAGGFATYFGSHNLDISGNIQTDAGMSPAERASYSTGSSGGMSVGGATYGWYHPQLGTTNNNNFHANFVINRGGASSWNTGEGANISGVTNLVVSAVGSESWNMPGRTYTTTLAALAGAGATSVTLASVAGMDTSYPTYNIGITQTDSSVFWTTLTAPPTAVGVTLSVALPVGAASGAAVTVAARETYNYRATTLNTFQLNTVIGQSNTDANAHTYTVSDTAGATAVDDTTYTGNSYMSTSAAASAGYDIDRCLAKYCQSLHFPLAATDQVSVRDAIVAYVKANMRKGQYDSNFVGKAPVNYVRAGVGLAALP